MAKLAVNDLMAFAAIAKHRSFRLAALEVGQSPSALSHMVRGLEKNLGVRLLNRTTRSVALSEAGEYLLANLSAPLDDMAAVLSSLDRFKGAPSGRLRLNAPEIGARVLLRHVIPKFLVRYPDAEIDLCIENRPVDIIAEGFDAGVRMGYSVPQDMIAVRFDAEDRFLPLASPDYLARHGAPERPHDLYQHICIRNRLPNGKLYRWEFERNGEKVTIDAKGPLMLNHMQVMIEAAVDGLGIAYTLERAAREYIEGGRLIPILEEWCPAVEGISLYYSGHRQVPSCLRAFIDTMKAAMQPAI